MYTQSPPKNPTLAAILSFLINGLGQIYNGEIAKGIIIIVVQIINVALMSIIIGFVTAPIVFIWSIYDAYKVAQRINEEAMKEVVANSKQCPQCAERVQADAKVCRHCGYQFVPVAATLAAPSPVQPVIPTAAPSAQPAQPVAAQTKFCPQCGQQIQTNARFCMSCGHAFEQPQPAVASAPPAQPDVSMDGHAPEQAKSAAPPSA